MSILGLDGLRADLECVWAADTAADSDAWSPERPSTGHCAVTALVIQKLRGGAILRVPLAVGGSHYYNEIDECLVDLTVDQFPVYATSDAPFAVKYRTPAELLANENTRARFELLWMRLGEHWYGA